MVAKKRSKRSKQSTAKAAESFDDFMRRISKGAEVLVTSRQGIADMIAAGMQPDAVPERTREEELQELFRKRLDAATARAKDLSPGLHTGVPELDSLMEEIHECIVFGTNGAAITLCCLYIEVVLKHAIWVKRCGGYKNANTAAWRLFFGEKTELSDAINLARKERLITKALGKILHSFRKRIRNPYLHYDIYSIVGEQPVTVRQIKHKTREFEDVQVLANDARFASYYKQLHDRQAVLDMYTWTQRVANEVLSALAQLIADDP